MTTETTQAPVDAGRHDPTPPAGSGSGRWWLVVLLVAALAFMAALAVRHEVFPYYSGDHDEPVLRYQAQMLREGIITIPRAQEEFFRPWLTGPHDDRLVPAFQPLWPAVLMVSEVVTGSMVFALGFAAALLVIATFLLARELLATEARAALASVLVAASPFVLMLSGTYLSYVFSVALGAALAVSVLRALRTGSRGLWLTAGVVLGLLVLARPYDAVLFALPLAGFTLLTRRHALRSLVAPAGWFAIGFVPLLALALAYNVGLTGNPLAFGTTVQSEGASTFFWGERSIAPDTPILDFTVGFAFGALRDNLWATPTWLFGTYLAVAAAVYGAVRYHRTEGPRFWLLLAMTFVFPVGYLIWWASALTVGGAWNGIGPHYYVPMVVPLGILTAHGTAVAFARLRSGRTVAVVAVLAGALVLTAISVLPKIDNKIEAADDHRADADVVREVEEAHDGRLLVIQERRRSPYVMEPYPFFANDPQLENRLLFALDRGSRGIDLLEQHPDRTAYRLVRQLRPGDSFSRLPVVAVPQSVVRGSAVRIPVEITNTSGNRWVTAYLRWGDHREARLLDAESSKGRTYRVEWTITPDGIEYAGPDASETRFPRHIRRGTKPLKGTTPAPQHDLVVGAAFAKSPRTRDPDRVELDYYGRVREVNGTPEVQLLSAGEQWTRLGAPFHAWLPTTVENQLEVELVPEP